MKQRSNTSSLPGTRAVVRAITVLKTMGRSPGAHGISEIGSATGLSKATVFRLLGALETEGMVARDISSGNYTLGPELINLGNLALSTTDLRSIAHDELVEVSALTGETATLEVLVGTDVIILDEVKGRFLVGSTPEIGHRWPAHGTSTGKLLLALSPEGPAPTRLARLAPRTIVSRESLERELQRIRKHDYAIAVDELEPGLVALAAPIRNHTGRAVAALSINAPGARLTPPPPPRTMPALCRAANRISRRLGAAREVLTEPASNRRTPPTKTRPRNNAHT
jgi:IclR family transcriptional regulator, acetate operon repressor